MSLNDTLTCGFGASVLLFVTFAVIVSLQDVPDGNVAAVPAMSVAEAAGRSGEPLLIRVRGDCDYVSSLTNPSNGGFVVKRLRDGRRLQISGGWPEEESVCVSTFRTSFDPERHGSLVFESDRPRTDVWHVTILLGGERITRCVTGCDLRERGRSGGFVVDLVGADRRIGTRQ